MRQSFLDKSADIGRNLDRKDTDRLRILIWNLRNPSIRRAIDQCKWLENVKSDILVLTELKSPKAAEYFRDRLAASGFRLFYNLPNQYDYFTAIAAPISSIELQLALDFLPQRVAAINVEKKQGCRLSIMGLYVPSRGPIAQRNIDKRKFQDSIISLLKSFSRTGRISKLVIAGDLNVIEPDHVPAYPFFGDWEYQFYEYFEKVGMIDAFRHLNTSRDYSWYGRGGEGYRFDHAFVSRDLESNLERCYYEREPIRLSLSDHSAMLLELAI